MALIISFLILYSFIDYGYLNYIYDHNTLLFISFALTELLSLLLCGINLRITDRMNGVFKKIEIKYSYNNKRKYTKYYIIVAVYISFMLSLQLYYHKDIINANVDKYKVKQNSQYYKNHDHCDDRYHDSYYRLNLRDTLFVVLFANIANHLILHRYFMHYFVEQRLQGAKTKINKNAEEKRGK